MKLGIVMDPIETIKPYKDTTVAIIQKANAMGWACHSFTPGDIFCRDGKAYASLSAIKVTDLTTKHWAEVTPGDEGPLTGFDIILMRKDPPFDMNYIYATYALDLAQKSGVLVANNPQSLRDANEKFFTLAFPQCCPPTVVTSQIGRLKAFWQRHKEVIFKPLEGMGGRSVFHVGSDGKNLSVILEMLTEGETRYIMGQQYISDISKTGDKRILMVDGKPIPYALARIPAKGELRGNLAAGATGKVVPLTKRDAWLCEQLSNTLIDKGLYFVGIDVIGDYLTEINVTSPTCLQEIEKEADLDIAGIFLEALAKKVRTQIVN